MDNFFEQSGENHIKLVINKIIYSLPAVFRTCYLFTGRSYLYLCPGGENEIEVHIKGKTETADLQGIAGEFCNELVDQQVRVDLARETSKVRELIVAQAFAEGNLLDEVRDNADFEKDPLGIAKER